MQYLALTDEINLLTPLQHFPNYLLRFYVIQYTIINRV